MNLPNFNGRSSSLSRLSNVGIKRNQQITTGWLHHFPQPNNVVGGERSTSCSIRGSPCNFVVGQNKNTNTNSNRDDYFDENESSTLSTTSSSSSSSSIDERSARTRSLSSPLSSSKTPVLSQPTPIKKSTNHNCHYCSSESPTSLLVLLDFNPAILVSSASSSTNRKEETKDERPPRRTSWNKKVARFSCDRSVHFSSSVQCRFIESRRRMIKKSRSSSFDDTTGATSTRGISSYWYDEEEMEAIHNELLESVRQMRARESRKANGQMLLRLPITDEDPQDLCVRGLERFRRRDVMTDRSLQDRVDSIDAVLRIQAMRKRHSESSMVDHDAIAQTYSRFSLRSQHLAMIRAKSDEAYVNQYVRQVSIVV